jgi:hypothetical protein
MKFYSCSRESELMTALREQRWPEACEPELRSHVERCHQCSDLVLVSKAVQQAHRQSTQAAILPAPGILWRRAQLMRRNGAIERFNKPIVLAEKIAWAGTCAVAVALTLWQRNLIGEWFSAMGKISDLWLVSVNGWTVALLGAALGTVSLLGGVAVYLAAKED